VRWGKDSVRWKIKFKLVVWMHFWIVNSCRMIIWSHLVINSLLQVRILIAFCRHIILNYSIRSVLFILYFKLYEEQLSLIHVFSRSLRSAALTSSLYRPTVVVCKEQKQKLTSLALVMKHLNCLLSNDEMIRYGCYDTLQEYKTIYNYICKSVHTYRSVHTQKENSKSPSSVMH